ncbi:MAG TPA: type II toxin-antitoxin system VapC family toxin [Thermoanaerobaculia bacterium]|nr:type II toxin-antitoxin system VapC family toxin [Thermoanaerobaculia bacterium]
MILLDTNVVSAFMQREVDPSVVRWLNDQAPESIWTTSITVLEVRMGLGLLAAGKRRRLLEEAFEKMLEEDFEQRVLAFDTAAAHAAGRIAAERRRAGRPVEIRDLQIAGIATARRAAIATRNVRHFEGLTIPVIDPWTA